MGLWPVSARRQAPDVRAGEVGFGVLWTRGAGFPGLVAGCPGVAEAPDVRAGAGCPAADGTWRLLWVRFQGPDVRGPGRMSGSWELSPSSSSIVASMLPSRMA